MSAFIVDQGSIDYVLSHLNSDTHFYAATRTFLENIGASQNRVLTFHEKLTAIKSVLFAENIRSVHHLYGGKYFDYEQKPLPFKKVHGTETIQALKSLDCLKYQSCECHDFNTTLEYQIITEIGKIIITQDPRYQEAQWN